MSRCVHVGPCTCWPPDLVIISPTTQQTTAKRTGCFILGKAGRECMTAAATLRASSKLSATKQDITVICSAPPGDAIVTATVETAMEDDKRNNWFGAKRRRAAKPPLWAGSAQHASRLVALAARVSGCVPPLPLSAICVPSPPLSALLWLTTLLVDTHCTQHSTPARG